MTNNEFDKVKGRAGAGPDTVINAGLGNPELPRSPPLPFLREFTATVIEGGRVTIPDEVRKDLGIRKGDRVRVWILEVSRAER